MSNLKNLEQELKKLQKQTTDEQRKWRSQKGALVREITGLKAKHADLLHRNTELDEQIKLKQAEIDRLDELANSLETGIKAKHKAFEKSDRQHKTKTAELKHLDEQIRSKKTSLDAELEDYRQSQLQELNQQLLPLQNELTTLESDLTAKKQQLTQIKSDIVELETQKASRSTELDEILATKQAQAENLGQTIEELQTLIEDLQSTRKQLLYERDQAIADANKAKIEHEQYIKYEQKARDALNAKDKSLQLREDEVEKSSVLMRNARSNLPPM